MQELKNKHLLQTKNNYIPNKKNKYAGKIKFTVINNKLLLNMAIFNIFTMETLEVPFIIN